MNADPTKLHLARLLSKIVACDRCVFYDIDGDLTPNGHIAHDEETRWVAPYARFFSIDPMRPELHVKSEDSVIVTGWNYSTERLHRSAYYEGFMHPIGQRHKAELFFRNHAGRMVAGARLSRRRDRGEFSSEEVSLLRAIQPVLQGHMKYIAMIGAYERSGPFLILSAREWDVARLAAAGLSNKLICERLGTGLPTVKTHLAAAFRKLSLRNRAELMTLYFAARDRNHAPN